MARTLSTALGKKSWIASARHDLPLVLLRSNLDPTVFAAHKRRFLIAPLVPIGIQILSP